MSAKTSFFAMQRVKKDRKGLRMTRRQIREAIFKLIFQIEFHEAEDLPEQLRLSLEEETDLGEDQAYVEGKCRDLMDKVEEIDACINSSVTGWKTTRMSKVDLTIIRLAVYEMKYEELARGIAINEAVEIAKKYSGEQSASFVNGALARIS